MTCILRCFLSLSVLTLGFVGASHAEPMPDNFADMFSNAKKINWVNASSLNRKYYPLAAKFLQNPKELNHNKLNKMFYAFVDLNGDARPELLLHDNNWKNPYCTISGCQMRIYQDIDGKMKSIFGYTVDSVRLVDSKTNGYTDLILRGAYSMYLIWSEEEQAYVSKYDIDPFERH